MTGKGMTGFCVGLLVGGLAGLAPAVISAVIGTSAVLFGLPVPWVLLGSGILSVVLSLQGYRIAMWLSDVPELDEPIVKENPAESSSKTGEDSKKEKQAENAMKAGEGSKKNTYPQPTWCQKYLPLAALSLMYKRPIDAAGDVASTVGGVLIGALFGRIGGVLGCIIAVSATAIASGLAAYQCQGFIYSKNPPKSFAQQMREERDAERAASAKETESPKSTDKNDTEKN
jgi:hypothetical protein